MSLSTTFFNTTCDLFRPFGSPTAAQTGIPCRLVADMRSGRGTGAASATMIWSHYIDVDDSTDIRDGCFRIAGVDAFTYSEGDEVRIPDSSGTRYVVVWVEMRNVGTAKQFKRAYLMRDAATWPGP
jgi:hypothetical protein